MRGYAIIRPYPSGVALVVKKLVIALLLAALGRYAAWQSRIELLVGAVPRVHAIVDSG